MIMTLRLLVLPAVIVLFAMCTRTEVHELEDGRWIDLTHSFSEETLFWPTSSVFKLDTVFTGHTDAGFYYEAYEFCTAEHGGPIWTHPSILPRERKRLMNWR